jgi:hypothetical protein
MKKTYKYIILTVAGILLYRLTKAGTMSNKFAKFTNNEALKLLALQNSLQIAGINNPQLDFALAQLLFETGKFTSKSTVAADNNNYSGIKWLNKPYQKATKGTLAPAGERLPYESPVNYYAKFASINDWATDFKRILSLKRSANTLGAPIKATTPEDFVKRLKLNGYFGGNETVYLKGIKNFLAKFQ